MNIYIVRVSQESLFRDLMTENLLSQKRRIHMGPILNVSVVKSF